MNIDVKILIREAKNAKPYKQLPCSPVNSGPGDVHLQLCPLLPLHARQVGPFVSYTYLYETFSGNGCLAPSSAPSASSAPT